MIRVCACVLRIAGHIHITHMLPYRGDNMATHLLHVGRKVRAVEFHQDRRRPHNARGVEVPGESRIEHYNLKEACREENAGLAA